MCVIDNEEKEVLKIYKLVRSHIEFEYSQIGNRLNWLIASQAFLFVALVINLSSVVNLLTPNGRDCVSNTTGNTLWSGNIFEAVDIIHNWSLLYPIVPILGLLISLCVIIGTLAAILRISDLKNKENYLIKKLEIPVSYYKYAVISRNKIAHYLGLVPIIFIPISFVIIWYFIIDPNLFFIDLFSGDVSKLQAGITITSFILNFGYGILIAVIFIDKKLNNEEINSCINIILNILITIFVSLLFLLVLASFKVFSCYDILFLGFILSVAIIISNFPFYFIACSSIKNSIKNLMSPI